MRLFRKTVAWAACFQPVSSSYYILHINTAVANFTTVWKNSLKTYLRRENKISLLLFIKLTRASTITINIESSVVWSRCGTGPGGTKWVPNKNFHIYMLIFIHNKHAIYFKTSTEQSSQLTHPKQPTRYPL